MKITTQILLSLGFCSNSTHIYSKSTKGFAKKRETGYYYIVKGWSETLKEDTYFTIESIGFPNYHNKPLGAKRINTLEDILNYISEVEFNLGKTKRSQEFNLLLNN